MSETRYINSNKVNNNEKQQDLLIENYLLSMTFDSDMNGDWEEDIYPILKNICEKKKSGCRSQLPYHFYLDKLIFKYFEYCIDNETNEQMRYLYSDTCLNMTILLRYIRNKMIDIKEQHFMSHSEFINKSMNILNEYYYKKLNQVKINFEKLENINSPIYKFEIDSNMRLYLDWNLIEYSFIAHFLDVALYKYKFFIKKNNNLFQINYSQENFQIFKKLFNYYPHIYNEIGCLFDFIDEDGDPNVQDINVVSYDKTFDLDMHFREIFINYVEQVVCK